MNEESTNMSLIEVLKDRRDTGFDGVKVPGQPPDEAGFVSDGEGQWYTNPHDHVGMTYKDEKPVGVFVGDVNGRNCNFPGEFDDIPHLIGLYVREAYRGDGIATALVDAFMESVEENSCVVDCEHAVVPFYEQLQWDIVYGYRLKTGGDPRRPHDG